MESATTTLREEATSTIGAYGPEGLHSKVTRLPLAHSIASSVLKLYLFGRQFVRLSSRKRGTTNPSNSYPMKDIIVNTQLFRAILANI